MSVHDPGTLMVECDDCGDELEMDTTQYADTTFGIGDDTVEENGWLVIGQNEHYCPECRKEHE